ncbi:sulfatase [Porifericola rhodea]|uniref:sulfatase family protein n=1 Tax=Porifericola rhodea TaxID=930972 RepID=UPI002666B8CB|nr:sulfatase [Porifericola rhodea]WKN33847.1 sulfatase [Porifericola rhodea]
MRLLNFFVLGLLFVSACTHSTQENNERSSTPQQRPNIVFIMTDDHAFQAISAYGSEINKTPNIDRIAREGMLFNKAFVTNSICAPSRAVILTGKHSHLNGVVDNVARFDSTQVTFPKLLREAGYNTAMIGKWHLKSQPTGFDYWKVLPGQGHYYNPDFRTKDGMVREEGYVTDIITNEAINWLKSGREQDKPFLLMYQHKAPHREWLPSPDHLGMYKGEETREPETLFDDYEGRGTAAKEAEMRIYDHMGLTNDSKVKPEIVNELGYEEFLEWYPRAFKGSQERMNEEQQAAWNAVYDSINQEFQRLKPKGKELTRWKFQRYMDDYLASIASVDDNVGRLLDYLEESGLDENTIIVYTSDQGFYLGEHGWFDKRFMYEESFRTPLMVKWKGVTEAGSENNQLVQNLDFAQTFLEAAGVEAPEEMQGESLLPFLKGEEPENWRDAVYYHYYEYPSIHAVKRHYGVRTDRYKLIHFYHDVDEWEFYDLEKDPQEMQSRYNDPEYQPIIDEMKVRIQELREQYGDSDELIMSFINK